MISVTHLKRETEMMKFMVKYVVLMLLIVGCAGLDKEKENWMKFDETSTAYIRSLRWGEYEAAYGFKRLPGINDEVPDFQDLSDVRVTSYRMRNVTVRTITDRQKWEYDKQKERWYLLSDLPHFE